MKPRNFLMLSVVLTALLLASSASSLWGGSKADDVKRVQATEFILIDSKGRTRGIFGCGADDSPSLRLFDEQTRGRLTLRVQPDGMPFLTLESESARPVVVLNTTTKGDPILTLSACEGRRSLGFIVSSNAGPSIGFSDNQPQTRLQIGLLDTGPGAINYFDDKMNLMKQLMQPAKPENVETKPGKKRPQF